MEEKTWNKKNTVSSRQKLVFNSRNEGLATNYVPVEEKTASIGSSWLMFEKMEKNDFH